MQRKWQGFAERFTSYEMPKSAVVVVWRNISANHASGEERSADLAICGAGRYLCCRGAEKLESDIFLAVFFLKHAPISTITYDDKIQQATVHYLGLFFQYFHYFPILVRWAGLAGWMVVDEDIILRIGQDGA